MTGGAVWTMCGFIILVAAAGRWVHLAGARLTGSDTLTAISLGVLMNTRGLMELIVLNVGHDMNIISPCSSR